MLLDFRIDWGYQYLYSRRHYHPIYEWDGELRAENGSIVECRQLDYPVIWYGPGHCAKETPLPGPRWRSRTRRGLAGIRCIAEVSDETVFHLKTLSGEWSFSAARIREEGRIVFGVGPKYLGCHVIVTRSRYYWFRPQPKAGQRVWEADDLPLPVRDWARMRVGWLDPGASLELEADFPETGADVTEELLHLEVMAAPGYTPGAEKQCDDYFPFRLESDGELLHEGRQYLRYHDTFMQMQEDMWLRFRIAPGRRRLRFTNLHPKWSLLITRAVLTRSLRNHLQLSLPAWGLVGEPLHGSVFAARPETTEIRWPGGGTALSLVPGWNDFAFSVAEPGVDLPVSAGASTGRIGAVYALSEEDPPVTVGYDMTVVPHDDCGFMDWLLNYTWRTRLGNLVVFRSFFRDDDDCRTPADPRLMERWGEYCRKYRIHVEAATDFDGGALTRGAGEMLHSVGRHEWPGAVYAFDPQPGSSSSDMKEAMEHYLAHLRIEIDRAHRAAPRAAFGDASGGHRYCYLAGADFLRTETMVPHTQHLCSQARPAAEALGSGEWGVHIAIQHPCQPYFPEHLGLYYLSLMQPYLMGASMIYEEDSLFLLFKEERQSWDDALTRGKRDMTRDFFRFAKTHPRHGRQIRNIAFWEGRYAAPFNGFICDSEQTPDYSVWGKFGNDAPEWGHRQPEKCRHLLDVLMPGASVLPLRQRFDRRRFFFSGTPYGDFDEVPAEAGAEYLLRYRLLLNLGWNTMIDEDYAKLKSFVEAGGILLTGLPQFSTHLRREFLRDMRDLALWRDGDLSELCGIRVRGAGKRYSGIWNAAERERYPEPELSSRPNSSPDEDGECLLAEVELVDAETVAWDADSGAPVVVRKRCGKGFVYTFTAWCYPGHERFQRTAASFVAKLAGEVKGDIFVEDPSKEVYWSLWHDGAGERLALLNTDWTEPGGIRRVTIHTPEQSFPVEVKERRTTFLLLAEGCALEYHDGLHVEEFGGGRAVFHGTGKERIVLHRGGEALEREIDFGNATSAEFRFE